MNIQSKPPTTADEFLRWNEGREGKREFVRGRVVEMMINVTRNHWRLSTRLAQQLISQLGTTEFDIGTADFGVRTPDGIRFPDVLVERFSPEGKALATPAPLLVAEVLSPSSVADDFGSKARDYLSVSSLLHYVVVAQDEIGVWVWSRSPDGWASPERIADLGQAVPLPALGVTIDLRSLYLGIVQ